jgi:hypothetical protein
MAGELPSSIEVVLGVVAILDELRVRYHIGGSFAAAIHGVPRQTRDADVVVDLDAGTAAQLVERLQVEFYIDAIATAMRSRAGARSTRSTATGFKVTSSIGRGDLMQRSLTQRAAGHYRRSALPAGETAEDTSAAAVVPRRW